MPPRLQVIAALLALISAVLLVNPRVMTDPDALTNLALGRHIHQTGAVPSEDPFTFSAPGRPWRSPEWLGALAWYELHRLGAIQQGKLCLLALAWGLLFLLCLHRGGASPWIALGVLLLFLPGAAWRFTLRNHLHAFWLVPLYGLILARASAASSPRVRRGWLLALLPAAVLWANLHASFVLGWLLMGAAALDAWRAGHRTAARGMFVLLCLHPLLALISPHGTGNYDQLLEHLRLLPLLQGEIQEWGAASQTLTATARVPLLLLVGVGPLSFVPRYNRRAPGSLLLATVAVGLALLAQRFIPLAVFLAAPALVANLARILARVPPRPRVLATGLTLMVALLGVFALHHGAAAEPLEPLLRRANTPAPAARFLAAHAPHGSRLFNGYDAGPFFLWLAHPVGVRIYIDPRNHRPDLLRRYLSELLPSPSALEREVEAAGITLAHLDLDQERSQALAAHLGSHPRWALVFFDGLHAIFARRLPLNRALIRDHALLSRGYEVVKTNLKREPPPGAGSTQIRPP